MTTDESFKPVKPVRIRPRFARDDKRRFAAELFAHGIGYTKAAAILGLSENTVRDWARAYKAGRFGVELSRNQGRYTEQTRRQAVEMRNCGVSWRQISAATGASVAACRKWYLAAQAS